jgi:hypothetical protein
MRTFLLLFFVPMVTFWGWYLMSAADVGYVMFSREMHEYVFFTYGQMMGIEPELLPPMIVRACIFDTFIVLGIWAFRRRREIAAWWRKRQASVVIDPVARRYAEVSSPGNS